MILYTFRVPKAVVSLTADTTLTVATHAGQNFNLHMMQMVNLHYRQLRREVHKLQLEQMIINVQQSHILELLIYFG